jgi:hypothetical protein
MYKGDGRGDAKPWFSSSVTARHATQGYIIAREKGKIIAGNKWYVPRCHPQMANDDLVKIH